MNPTRRSFLKTSAAGAAFGLPAANVLGANETLNIGCIGTGGRCRALMKSLAKIANVRIAAVCDIYDAHVKLARELADPQARATKHSEQWVLGKGMRGLDFHDKPDGELLHLSNWIDCVRSRQRPNAPAETGVRAAAAAHLANQALRAGQVAVWKD